VGPAHMEPASMDCTVPSPLLKGEGLLHADMPGTHLLTTGKLHVSLASNFTLYIIVVKTSMEKSYVSSRAVPIWFDDATVVRLNQMALNMEMPRNRIVRRMLELMLADIDKGRMLYPEEKCS
jgi:hypothetical protein